SFRAAVRLPNTARTAVARPGSPDAVRRSLGRLRLPQHHVAGVDALGQQPLVEEGVGDLLLLGQAFRLHGSYVIAATLIGLLDDLRRQVAPQRAELLGGLARIGTQPLTRFYQLVEY